MAKAAAADDDQQAGDAGPDAQEGDHTGGPTLAELDQRMARMEGLVEKFVSGAHADASATTQQHLDAPGAVAAEVQAELARRDEAARAAERESELENLKTTVGQLAEKVPAPPVRTIERVMGWHR